MADEVFKYFVYEGVAKKEMFVVESQGEGTEPRRLGSLFDWRSRWQKGQVVLQVPPLRTNTRFQCRIFMRGVHVFWLFADIHARCHFEAAKGSVSKWLSKSVDRWEEFLRSAIGLVGHLIRRPMKAAGAANCDRVLDHAACSSIALFGLGMAWVPCPLHCWASAATSRRMR